MAGCVKTLLGQLLARGDIVAVERGRLTITPASGCPVPVDWLQQHERQIVIEAARAADVTALEYQGYSVGNYGQGKLGGVTLQFRNLVDGSERYSIFNAETRRNRNTQHGKKGAPLPRGHFRVTERFKFYSFWLSTGLPVPRRLSAFHDYMGKLGSILFTGPATDDTRVGNPCPLFLTHATLVRQVWANLPDNPLTSPGQCSDNFRTSLPDKESSVSKQQCGLERIQSTGIKNHGDMVKREHGHTGVSIPPEEQTHEEWLAAYDSAS